jgi:Domain of unknown function (DUF5615)
VRVFLDENFPLGLERQLKNAGFQAEHVITIGWRGASDARIRNRLGDADLLFLTQDEDFLFSKGPLAIIVVSRVKQSRPLRERIEVWQSAVEYLIANPPTDRRFDLMDDGQLMPWAEGSPNVWTRKAPLPKS